MEVLSPSEGSSPTKLGLALSGGGFRAAFFHLGVLARLAERGRLRRVEVISTVSGGSIVGALYYLHVRDLLQPIPRKYTDWLFTRVGPVLVAPFLWLGSRVTLALTPTFLNAGRVDVVLGPDSATGEEQPAIVQ